MAPASPLLEVEHLELHFPIRGGLLSGRSKGVVRAVDDVSFQLAAGETLGLVGESGCGKSTLARAIIRLLEPTSGRLAFKGEEITHASRRSLAPLRRELQMVFQDPSGSLNPRKTVGQTVALPLRLNGVGKEQTAERVRELLDLVGLAAEHAGRYPYEFSGGQRQRVGIARALALEPELIVLDEPVSALDVSVQAQVINLLADLQRDLDLTYLFVAHDLSVVRHVSDRVAVMYLGKLMEVSPAEDLYAKPIHPYTDALLAVAPKPDPAENRRRERVVLPGEPPDSSRPPSGCTFHPRCPRATSVCREVEPPLREYRAGHLAACHHPLNVSPGDVVEAPISRLSPRSAGPVESASTPTP